MKISFGISFFLVAAMAAAQGRGPVTAEQIAARNSTEAELESVAIIERKVMVPMRDGKRMAADIYRPKDTSKKYPIIFVRTPYNFNYWDVRNGAPRDMTAELDAVKRGYVYVEMNERGHFFSEGNYDILGPPLTGWRRRDHVDVDAALVERQSGHHRLLVDGGMAAGRGGAGQSGVRGDDPAGIRRGRGPRRAVLTSKATGIAAARCRCCSSRGSTGSRTRCGRCFRRTLRKRT